MNKEFEEFKYKIKDCLITKLTLDEIKDIIESVENGNISTEEAFDQFKIWSCKVKINEDFTKQKLSKPTEEKDG